MKASTANTKAQKKEASRLRILQSARKLFSERGIHGASVADIMKEAGLTHGGFYAHFKNKADLVNATFTYTLDDTREQWFQRSAENEGEDIKNLIDSYLTASHRDHRASGCPFSCLTPEMSLDKPHTADSVEKGLKKSLQRTEQSLSEDASEKDSRAAATLAMLIGGMMLSRSVKTKKFSNFLLEACKTHAYELHDIEA